MPRRTGESHRKVTDARQALDGVELARKRLDAERLDERLVREAPVEPSHLLLDRARRLRSDDLRFENAAHRLLGPFAQLREGPIVRPIRPAAVDEPEEIVLRPDRSVHAGRVDAGHAGSSAVLREARVNEGDQRERDEERWKGHSGVAMIGMRHESSMVNTKSAVRKPFSAKK